MIETKQNSNFRRIYKGVNIRYMRKMWDEKMWDEKMCVTPERILTLKAFIICLGA